MRGFLHALGLAVVCALLMVLAAPAVVCFWLWGLAGDGWRNFRRAIVCGLR